MQRTTDVVTTIMSQSLALRLVTLNISPPNCTISICPTKMTAAMIMNPLQSLILASADLPVMNALALNMFQNCNITKMVKNKLNS